MARETTTIVGSQRLIEMLCKINHTIAYDLIEQLRYRGSSTISYLDFGESSDSISFIYSNKIYELQREFDYKWTEKVWKEKRAEMKIGKVIKQIFGDRYPVNNPKGQPMPKPPIDIESFVNLYKAEREKNENSERFHIVSGQDIVFWYNYKNYTRFVREDTPLGKSCLRYEESGKFLEMYVKNPEKVSMLILKDDQDKLRGRAIVWNLDVPENRIYMDRIYTVNDFDVELFKDFARKNGWLYKERQTFGWDNIIVDSRNNNLYTPSNLKLEVVLNDKKIKYYPYLDTLSVYNKKKGILNNQGQLLRNEGYLHLIDYQGSYVDEVDHREYVYSNFYGEEIVREDAVYCQIDDDWVYNHDSVYVHNTDGLYAIRTSDKIVHSKFLNKSKYFLKEDAVYSEFMQTWIYKDSVREAYINKEKTEKGIIHFRLIGKTFHKDDNGDIVIGEPKIDESKKKQKIKKKGLDLETFYGYINGNPTSVRLLPDAVISQMIQDEQIIFESSPNDEQNNDDSMEEEGDGSHRPIPRGRRRRGDGMQSRNIFAVPREEPNHRDIFVMPRDVDQSNLRVVRTSYSQPELEPVPVNSPIQNNENDALPPDDELRVDGTITARQVNNDDLIIPFGIVSQPNLTNRNTCGYINGNVHTVYDSSGTIYPNNTVSFDQYFADVRNNVNENGEIIEPRNESSGNESPSDELDILF